MNPLRDNALVRGLKQAVRQTSPDDWKASRRRLSLRQKLSKMGTHIWTILAALLVADFACLPFLADKPAPLPMTAASGLLALNFLGMGLAAAHLLYNHTSPSITPLANTPANGQQIYRYILFAIRRQVRIKCAAVVGYGFATLLLLRLITWNNLSVEALVQILAATLPVVGSSLAVGIALYLLAGRFRRGVPFLFWTFGFLFSWELGGFFLPSIVTTPGRLGELLFVVPQAQIFHWLATGGPWPAAVLTGCTGGLLVAVFLILHQLRDRGYTFAEDATEPPLEWTAESLAAEVLQQWKKGDTNRSYDLSDGDEAEVAEASLTDGLSGEKNAPLLVHPSAPEEHSMPISTEFKAALASRVNTLLHAEGTKCPLERSLIPQPSTPWRMTLAWRWAVAASVIFPTLCEATAWLPPSWRQDYGLGFIIAGLFPVALCLVLSLRPYPFTLPLHGSQWVRLPVDPAVHTRHFFRWQRSLLISRLLLVLGMLAGMASTGLLIIGLNHFLAVPVEGVVTLKRLVWGELSLLGLAGYLLVAVQSIRYLESLQFYRQMFAFITWRGLWKKISLIYGLFFLVSALALFAATSSILFFTMGEMGGGTHWVFTVACLAGGEVLHLTNRWIALQSARWGRGDWSGDL